MTIRMVRCLLVALAASSAFADDVEPKKADPPKADVRGVVKKLTALKAKGLVGGILVEGEMAKDTQYNKASVTLTSTTKFYKWTNGKKAEAKFTDITEGSKVQCVFTGPVAESLPVQAKASEVIILEAAKK